MKYNPDKILYAKRNWKEIFRSKKKEYLYLLKTPYDWETKR